MLTFLCRLQKQGPNGEESKSKGQRSQIFPDERCSALDSQRRGASCNKNVGILARGDRRGAASFERRGATRGLMNTDVENLGIKGNTFYTPGRLEFLERKQR